jgi:hypothetical protein
VSASRGRGAAVVGRDILLPLPFAQKARQIPAFEATATATAARRAIVSSGERIIVSIAVLQRLRGPSDESGFRQRQKLVVAIVGEQQPQKFFLVVIVLR